MRNPFILYPTIPASRGEFLVGFIIWLSISGLIGGISGGLSAAFPDMIDVKMYALLKGLAVGVGFIGLVSVCSRRLTDMGLPWWLVLLLTSLKGAPPIASICVFATTMCILLLWPGSRKKKAHFLESSKEKELDQNIANIKQSFSTPEGLILTQSYMVSCWTEETLLKKLPFILEYRRGKEFCNVLQVATIIATLLHIERMFGRQNYLLFHEKLVAAIDPSVRHIYMPLLIDLSSYLLKRPLVDKHLPAYDEIQELDEGDIEKTIGFWCVSYLKMAVLSTKSDSEISKIIQDIVYQQHVPYIVDKLTSYKMLAKIGS